MSKRAFADIRKRAGLTQGQVAARTGYSESHLRAVENGHAPLTEPLARALARAYGCTPSEIVKPRSGPVKRAEEEA